ncbi:MAG: ATP-binding cassette domain-containing protein [Promethearchaeota archaeon]
MNLLEVEGLSKVYLRKDGSAQVVLSNINFNIKKGECFTIIEGEEITALSKKDIINYRRKLSFVRQKPVVLNTSVYKNIVYGLKIRGMDPELIDKKVKEIIEIVGLKGLEDKNARALSGGEMQRVAIAMNFIVEPELYLLDEVSANLDSKNLKLLEQFISKIKDDEDKTIILKMNLRHSSLVMKIFFQVKQ